MVLVLVLVLVQMVVRMAAAVAVRAWSVPPACPSSAVHLSVLGRLVFHRDSRASTSGGITVTINELREPCIALIVVAPTHRVRRRRRRRRHRDQRVPALVFILVLVLVLRVGVGMCMYGAL